MAIQSIFSMKKTQPDIKRIAIFRALQLGDMLCAIPAIRALRATYPTSTITLLGLPWAESFCKRFNRYFDDFIHFPGFQGLPEQPFDQQNWDTFTEKMRAQPFDLILQMQGNGSIVNDMLEDIQAGEVAGFHSRGNYRPAENFLDYPAHVSEIERHILLMEHLGIPRRGTQLEFPVMDIERQNLYTRHPFVKEVNYVCIHPGSRGSWRQWPPSHFAALADECAKAGYAVVVTGTQNESDITRMVIDHMNQPAINLTGQTSLGEIGQLIKDAQMLISNCTGVSHIAAAVETRSIVISMDGEPMRWAPLNKQLHFTFDWTRHHDFDEVLDKTLLLLNPNTL
jgi:ADP-heptose:LPS heptosyltransferase